MKLIDKDDLIAKIDKFMYGANLEADIASTGECFNEEVANAKYKLCKQIKEEIDTLEVKEVDLEKELDKFYGMYRKDGQTFSLEDNEECVDWKVDCNPKFEKSFARHFFELGLKAQNKITSLQQQRISVMKMEFWTGLQTFDESEMTLSDAYNQGVDDILEELGLKTKDK